MKAEMRALGPLASVIAVCAMSFAMAQFAPPADGPVAFRRDKLPLDAGVIAALSRNVESLARGLHAETPADRRGAAQMLALALALDPANASARKLVAAFQKGRHPPEQDAVRLEKSRARIWQCIAWLETPEAGSEGQSLAACLKDVMVVSDPKHPKAAAIRQSGERGAWAGWVPALAAYSAGDSVASSDTPSETGDEPEVAPKPPANVPLEKAVVGTVLWQLAGTGENAKWSLAPGNLEMTASIREADPESGGRGPFRLKIGSGEALPPLAQTATLITGLLQKEHGKPPPHLRIDINHRDLNAAVGAKRRVSISAASAVLASAAITGVEPGAIVIGTVDESGAFKLPSSFWEQIQALGPGTGRRLILPAEAATTLPSILALENPAFFMQFEVLLAHDFRELLLVSAKTPAEKIAAPLAMFREIRERMGQQEVRQYIGNSFIRQRLTAVIQECPNHFSSKMLLVQASGGRPTTVATTVLAAELRSALEPMRWLERNQEYDLAPEAVAQIGAAYDLCRSKLDGFQRYVEKSDQPLFDKAMEVTIAVRGVDRATRTRGGYEAVTAATRAARKNLTKAHQAFTAALEKATAEGPR